MANVEQHLVLYDELMAAGHQALAQGDMRRAHGRWREAAIANPYSEEVWLALLNVVETPEDRAACLKNIIAINPLNTEVRRELRIYKTKTDPKPPKPKKLHKPPRSKLDPTLKISDYGTGLLRVRLRLFRHGLFTGIAVGLFGSLLAVLVTILLQVV